jgi:membrane glycosyltransferase
MLTGFTLAMLIVPKFISAFLLMLPKRGSEKYGGRLGLLFSMLGELIFSALLAPAMMMLHTKFVLNIFSGGKVAWEAQERGDAGVLWSGAWGVHKLAMLLGVFWGALALWISTTFFLWMLPVLLGLVLSSHLTVFTSKLSWGQGAKKLNLFVTPEESSPPAELRSLHRYEGETFLDKPCKDGLARVLSDPYAAALHQMLLPAVSLSEKQRLELILLVKKVMYLGTGSLTRAEKFMVLSYPMTLWEASPQDVRVTSF